MMKFFRVFGKNKKKRKNSVLFQKAKKTKSTYKKRKGVSIKIDAGFLKKINYLYYFLGSIFLGLLIYLFTFSDYFIIKKIKVERQDNYSNVEIAYSVLNEYVKDNIFLLDVSRVRKQLSESQENLGKVLISKQFPQTLKVNITSYAAIYNTQIKEKDYLILTNGSLVPGNKEGLQTVSLKFSKIPTFYEYKKVLSKKELRSIYQIEKLMKVNFVTTKFRKINYFIDEKEAHVILETGATLIFDLLGDPKAQIEKLAVFNEENMQLTNSTLIYTDLRIDGKLYFCTTKEEYNCYNSLNFIYGKER